MLHGGMHALKDTAVQIFAENSANVPIFNHKVLATQDYNYCFCCSTSPSIQILHQ